MYHHFRAELPLPRLPVLPGTGAKFTLDEDPRTLLDVVTKNLANPLVADQVVPLGSLLPLAPVILVTLACGQ